MHANIFLSERDRQDSNPTLILDFQNFTFLLLYMSNIKCSNHITERNSTGSLKYVTQENLEAQVNHIAGQSWFLDQAVLHFSLLISLVIWTILTFKVYAILQDKCNIFS